MAKTIVVPLDGSPVAESALEPAAALARGFGGELHFVSTPWDGDEERPGKYFEVVAGLLDARVGDMTVVDRDPAEAIARVVARSSDAVVCMATRGRTALATAVLGSVAADVVVRVRAPIVLVGPSVASGFDEVESLVVCIDRSERSEAMLHIAADWARALDVPVSLVSVVEPGAVEGLYTVDGDAAVTESRLQVLAGRIGEGVTCRCEVVRARLPARGIVRFAESLPHPLLALATHGRTGLARVALGSVAMGVVRAARCPVLTVRPSDLREG